MNGGEIIGLIGLFAAIYSIAPLEKQLDLQIRYKTKTTIVAILFISLVFLYFIYWETFNSYNIPAKEFTIQFLKGFDAKQSLLTTSIISIGAVIYIFLLPINFNNQQTKNWIKISDKLIQQKHYQPLSNLLEKYIQKIIKTFNGNKNTELRDNLKRIFNKPGFFKHISTERPYLILPILNTSIDENKIPQLLRYTILQKESVFYLGLTEDSEYINPDEFEFFNNLMKSNSFGAMNEAEDILRAPLKNTSKYAIIRSSATQG